MKITGIETYTLQGFLEDKAFGWSQRVTDRRQTALCMVSTDEGINFAKFYSERMEVPTSFRETSALTGEGVHDAFSELISLMSETGEVNIPERAEVRSTGTETRI